jgi:hypothetical protein
MTTGSEAALAILLAVTGTAVGGLITWLLAAIYFKKQDKRAEQIFEAQAHFLESLAGVVTKTGKVSITFTRDAKGKIMGATATHSATARDGAVASDSATATVRREK